MNIGDWFTFPSLGFERAFPKVDPKQLDATEFDWTQDLLGTLRAQTEMVETYYHYVGQETENPTMKRAHFIKDPAKIKAVLKENRNSDTCSMGGDGLIASVTGRANLLLCPYADHKRLRAPFEKSFNPRTIQNTLSRGIAQSIMDFMIDRDSRPFFIFGLLLYIAASCLFGLRGDQLREDLKRVSINDRKSLETFYRNYSIEGSYEQDGLMDKLQQAVEQNELTEEEAASTFKTFLTAGIHTTNAFLEFWKAEMIKNPESIQAINEEWHQFLSEYAVKPQTKEEFEEAVRVFSLGGEISGRHYKGSEWLEACYLETLRLYPIIPEISRVANQDFQIEGLSIERGDELHLNCLGYQRDPSVWSDPEAFKPERFIENPTLKSQLLSFSTGRQSCIGKHLARTTSKLFMGMMSIFLDFEGKRSTQEVPIRMFDFSLHPGSVRTIGTTWETQAEWSFIDAPKRRQSLFTKHYKD